MATPTLTTYGAVLSEIGYQGQTATMNPISTRNLPLSGAIAVQFGNAVARGAADNVCKAPTADADQIIGFAMRNLNRPADANNLNAYQQYDVVATMIDGDIFAIPVANVVQGDGVISLTAGNGTLSGTTAGAAGSGRIAVPGATWETTTVAGAVGLIRIKN